MNDESIRLLLVPGDPAEAAPFRELLAGCRRETILLDCLADFAEAREAIARKAHDAYLVDAHPGTGSGLELLREAIAQECPGPFILLTGPADRELDVAAMKAGAADCLIKEEITPILLERSLRYAIERKRSAEALRRSRQSLARAQQIARLGSWSWNIDSNEMTWSDELYRIFGFIPQEFPPSYELFLRSIHPDDRPPLNRAVNGALYAREPYRFEHRIILPLGLERTVLQQGEVSYDEAGHPLWMMGTVQDITERRRAEDSLRLLEEKFAKAFLASPDWIVITRVADGRYLEVNEAFLKITGYSRAEVIGRTSLELGIWAEPEERTRMLQLLDEHGKVRNFDVRFRIRSGEVRSMLWSAEVIELHDEACLIALARDVTEQRQLENELLKSQAKLFRKHEELQKVFDQVRIAKREWERTMDCVADMVILGDREGRIKRCNKAFQEFVGRPFAEILGADWAELLHQHELITGTIFLQSLELYHAPSGRWFTLNPYQFTDPQHEEASGTIIIIHDTTEQQLMSQKLESYQQAATLPTGTR